MLELAIGHAIVVAIALAIDIVIGVSLGVLVYRRENVPQTWRSRSPPPSLPSPRSRCSAFSSPSSASATCRRSSRWSCTGLLPILRNTVAGLRSVDPAIAESAQGMGMNARERLLRIELPLAWPVIIAGVRVSTMLLMGIAAIAAVVNGPGLGEDIFAGLARIGSATALNLVIGGILGIIVLALIFDTFFNVLGRLTTSRGIRD